MPKKSNAAAAEALEAPQIPDLFQKARARLIIQQPWFAALALRLKPIEDNTIPTLCTDGWSIRYNTKYLASLTPGQQLTAVCHEVLHNAFMHLTRCGARKQDLWNMAGDYVINLELRDCGFEPIPGWLCSDDFKDMAVEQVYALLEKEAKKYSGPCCFKLAPGDAKDPARRSEIEHEWKLAVAQAVAACQRAGKMPKSIERALKTQEPQVDWRPVVARWLTKPGDITWTRPNRRLVSSGLYMPGTVIDSLDTLVFCLDTSGSVSEDMLTSFAAEVNGVFHAAGRPKRVLVMYADAEVQKVDEIEGDLTFRPAGGGGTDFRPAFAWLEREGITPDVLFYLTDLEGPFGESAPYPTVWVAPMWSNTKPPFGELIRIDCGR